MDNTSLDKKDEALKAQRFKMLEDIARDLSGDVTFPTCFDAALQIRNVMRDPNVSLPQIAKAVRMEPLVAVKLLRVANSAAYNPAGRQIADVEAALSRVGLNLARSTALAVAMDQLLRSKDLVSFADMSKGLWLHTLKTAAAARVLARRMTRLNAEDALLAGLVHDLGAFYMLYRAAQYDELRCRPDTVRYLIVQWHESIGESLLAALGLPEPIIEAVRDHDQPRVPIERPESLSEVVYVANIIAGGLDEWERLHAGDPEPDGEYQSPAYLALRDEIEADYADLQNALGAAC
ncbi:HDOD domain-containing protein [Azospira restricta]|uniref:HDOD domain-containing protein n=1 Tax=Azospira restricta TaxID=404405 RepID=A0A974PVS1_9RHOO|nr:HDOD domain-containing protein [Azospira restricta]QRJ62236.1 HDOD domain-containing protein [Azospira restricta]